MDTAQPGAGWTGPGGFIKGKMSHADLWNRRATMWAGKGFFRSGGIVVRAGFTLPFRVGRVEGGRDIFSTGWAGAVSQASKQHAQIGIDIGGSAKRGTWASVGKMLVHADRWGKPGDGVDRRFRQPKCNQSERFQVLALAFFMQDVEPEGGFARTGHTGQDDELVLGDRKGDIFQVMQSSAANSDLSSHLASSDLQHPLRGRGNR